MLRDNQFRIYHWKGSPRYRADLVSDMDITTPFYPSFLYGCHHRYWCNLYPRIINQVDRGDPDDVYMNEHIVLNLYGDVLEVALCIARKIKIDEPHPYEIVYSKEGR
jgi:hypothetical protein